MSTLNYFKLFSHLINNTTDVKKKKNVSNYYIQKWANNYYKCIQSTKQHEHVVRPHFQVNKMRFREVKYFLQVLTFRR